MRRFRRRRSFRRRAKWDMQTFRDCERQVDLDLTSSQCETRQCNENPQIFADLLCGPIASSATPQIQGASRAMMYGGGHLKYRYDVSTINSSNMPCTFNVKVVTALVVLPLIEDDLTPAYLPNLAIARSQLSVVQRTESDTDENILYWNDANLIAYNHACSGLNGACFPTPTGCTAAETIAMSLSVLPMAAALYGRQEVETRIRVRRRLREREALFLLTEYVYGQGQCDAQIDWPIRRTVYHRYAVRPSR